MPCLYVQRVLEPHSQNVSKIIVELYVLILYFVRALCLFPLSTDFGCIHRHFSGNLHNSGFCFQNVRVQQLRHQLQSVSALCNISASSMGNCCAAVPEKNVLLAGRSGAGKTHFLYRLLLDVDSLKPQPTLGKGFNNEIVTLRHGSSTKVFEFFDPDGNEDMRDLWKRFYKNVLFHVVIYVVDATKVCSRTVSCLLMLQIIAFVV